MKNLLLAAVAVLSLTISNAQEREKGVFEIAPYVGFNSSNFNGDEVEGLDNRTGVAFGVHADYYFNDRWSLRSGINYLPMGADGIDGELELNYIAIPLNANWHFGSTRKWNLNFGFSPSFLTNAEFEGIEVTDGIESFQISLSYGIGYKLFINENFSLLFEAQNDLGITDFLEVNEVSRTNYGGSFNIGGVFNF
ncbi:hypothetical protein A9Q93_06400 [Nonlabens dokdonensis]|uniref:Outer membrane protein beta-barrel domain-containing protein n=1 Tax=Nonlabens dokdonensis TaxID=328515 RepID=A0A1Z8AZL4_9FLAO|nr:porin family protein [Nonlabens dokdonensis]OUS15774.1 hypothetical protein A9Q93_06400 [Nonlabens dokdonensis]